MKICSVCKKEKPISCFYIAKKTGTPISACSICKREQSVRWQRNNKDKVRALSAKRPKSAVRNGRLRHLYGIDSLEYDRMLAAQRGKCATCGDSPKRTLHVDHCHVTGRVRGLLCYRCNTALGLVRDNPETLFRLAVHITPQALPEVSNNCTIQE